MSPSEAESTISPEQRAKLQQLFAQGNKQMSIAQFDYANDVYFMPCVLADPGNVIYLKTFLANLKKKFGEKKKKGMFSFISGSTVKSAVGSKKPDQTFKAAIEAIKSDPWNTASLLSAGGACDEMGHHESALEYYRAAVDADPNDYESNRACAAALRENALFDEAIGCAVRMLKIKPGDQAAEKLRKDITVEKTIHKGKYAMVDSNQVRETASQMKSGAVAEDQDVMGRPLTYVEQVEKRIKKNPNDIANYIELAQYFYQLADYDKTEEFYLKAVELSKNDPEMEERLLDAQKQKLLSRVRKLKEEFETKRQEATKKEFYAVKEEYDAKNLELSVFRVKRHPANAAYRFEYGMLLIQRSQFKEAIAEFQHAKADVQKKGECLLALGQCFQQIKQFKLAMTHYQEAISEIQDSSENKKKTLYLAMKLAMSLEDYKTAEDYGHQLAAIDFSYKDLGDLLDKVATKRQNNS